MVCRGLIQSPPFFFFWATFPGCRKILPGMLVKLTSAHQFFMKTHTDILKLRLLLSLPLRQDLRAMLRLRKNSFCRCTGICTWSATSHCTRTSPAPQTQRTSASSSKPLKTRCSSTTSKTSTWNEEASGQVDGLSHPARLHGGTWSDFSRTFLSVRCRQLTTTKTFASSGLVIKKKKTTLKGRSASSNNYGPELSQTGSSPSWQTISRTSLTEAFSAKNAPAVGGGLKR